MLRLRLKAAADAASPEAVRPRGLRGPGPIKRPARHCQIPSCQAAIRQARLGGAVLLPLDQQFTAPCSNRCMCACAFLMRPSYRPTAREECALQEAVLQHQHTTRCSSALFDTSKKERRRCKEDATRQSRRQKTREKAVMSTKQLGLQTQQQLPGQD